MGLVVVFVVGDVSLIRSVLVVSVAALDIGDFVVDVVFSEAEALVDGNLVDLEEPLAVDGPVTIKIMMGMRLLQNSLKVHKSYDQIIGSN